MLILTSYGMVHCTGLVGSMLWYLCLGSTQSSALLRQLITTYLHSRRWEYYGRGGGRPSTINYLAEFTQVKDSNRGLQASTLQVKCSKNKSGEQRLNLSRS
jgi:hypothetical protein